MARECPDPTTNAVDAAAAGVMLMAASKTGPAVLRPILRTIATDPKHVAERNGYTRCRGAKPTYRPLSDSSTVPSTITDVPATMGAVTRSPSRTMARPVEMSGARLLIDDA